MKKLNFNVIYDRKKTASPKTTGIVELRFSYGGKQKYVSLGIKLRSTEWKDGYVVRNKEADELNDRLDAYRLRARNIVNEMIESGRYDLDEAVSRLGGKELSLGFVEYCEKRAEERNVCEHTKVRYRVFNRFMRQWGKIRSFADVNVGNVRNLDEYLHKAGKKDSTIYSYHKCLKLFIRDAIVDGYIEENPYDKLPFKVKRGDSQYVACLTPEQLDKMRSLKIQNGHLKRVWHLFLFQCYTGMAYSDLMAFDIKDCKKEKGKLFYHSTRTKTSTDFVFQILAPAKKILDVYDGVLPKISLVRYNDYLKAIGMMIGVEGLRSHMGRATAATLFLSKGMPINVVSKVLGHTTLRQTERYARTLNRDVKKSFDDLDKLIK